MELNIVTAAGYTVDESPHRQVAEKAGLESLHEIWLERQHLRSYPEGSRVPPRGLPPRIALLARQPACIGAAANAPAISNSVSIVMQTVVWDIGAFEVRYLRAKTEATEIRDLSVGPS